MRVSRLGLFNLVLVASMFAASAIALPRVPPLMPIHWNIHGQADGYAPKAYAVFLLPLVSSALLLLLFAMKKRVAAAGRSAYEKITTATMLFLAGLNGVILAIGTGNNIPMDRAMFTMMGALFIAIGVWMRDLPQNGVIGVRTPWTLRSKEIWARTHKLSGPLFVGAGMMFVLFAIVGASLPMLIGMIGVLVVVPIGYSYALSRRIF